MSLYFITCVFNPLGSKLRVKLYDKFVDHITQEVTGSKLVVVKCDLIDTELPLEPKVLNELIPERCWQIDVSTHSLLWNKENLLNIAIEFALSRDDCSAICWIDADITFLSPKVVCRSILSTLGHTPVIQPFQVAVDSGEEDGSVNKVQYSAAFSERLLPSKDKIISAFETLEHSGYAWAAIASFLKTTNGLVETCVVGSGDRQMLLLMEGKAGCILNPLYSRNFRDVIREWGEKAVIVTKGKVGYAPLLIQHGFHGKKSDRGYTTRYAILQKHCFQPDLHLTKNANGVLEWSETAPEELMRDVRHYFESRKEP